MFEFARKNGCKLRAALYGPSGSGKTYTALRLATGLAQVPAPPGSPNVLASAIGVIDSERKTARKYADPFSFHVLELETRTMDAYLAAIREARLAGMGILIVDSISHAWQDLILWVEKLSQAKFHGNTWAAWSEGTPRQHEFIDALMNYPGHLIVTMRVETNWVEDKDERSGRLRPRMLGLKPTQGKGIEYEFDLLMEMNEDHQGIVKKDRSGKFQDQILDKPGEDFGRQLGEWLSGGAAPATPPPRLTLGKLQRLIALHAIPTEMAQGWMTHFQVVSLDDLNDEQIEKLCVAIGTKFGN